MNNTGIYEIRNKANGHRYIGSAVHFGNRFRKHQLHLSRGTHHNAPLQRAWKKYGAAAFEFVPILTCIRTELVVREQSAFDEFKPEYNIAKASAAPMLGRKHTAEASVKMSEAQRGNTKGVGHKVTAAQIDALTRRNAGNKYAAGRPSCMPMLGKRHSAASIRKMSIAVTGRKRAPFSPEWRAKLSQSLIGNTRAKRKQEAA